MLSFELSVFDVVLATAIIVILLLQLKKGPTESPKEPNFSRQKRKPLKDFVPSPTTRKTSGEKELVTNAPEGSVDCSYHFGYLKTLPPGSSVPEKCYSCARLRECLFSNE